MRRDRTTGSLNAQLGQSVLTPLLWIAASWSAFAANTVVVPAGSTDALAAAIAEAGRNGTVVLESGLHEESGTITVDIPVSIVGKAGAVLRVTNPPDPSNQFVVVPAIHVFEADGAVVEGITLAPAVQPADVAILIQDSADVTVRDVDIADFFAGIWVQHGDRAVIAGNSLEDMWHGIIVLNGEHVRVSGNTAVGMERYGIWLCDAKGQCYDNSTSGCSVGILLCHLVGDFVWPDGSVGGAGIPATRWHVANNEAFDNFMGIWAVDGAELNVVNNNDISSSELVDILLDEDIVIDGVFYPGSYDNVVVLGSFEDVSVWDFGIGNKVIGAGD